MEKMENSRHTYAVFSEALPLAFSPSSIYTRAALNILRNSEFENRRYYLIGLSIIATNFPIIPFLAHYERFY